MNKTILVLVLVLVAASALGERIVVQPGKTQAELDAIAAATGARPGLFPALVDKDTGRWVHIAAGDEAAANAELDAMDEAAKPPEQLALESNYFASVDALYVLAGDPAPTSSTVPAAADVRAKAKKVKAAKGNSKKADDFLDLRNAQIELMELDLELRSYDPDWRSKAKRPKPL